MAVTHLGRLAVVLNPLGSYMVSKEWIRLEFRVAYVWRTLAEGLKIVDFASVCIGWELRGLVLEEDGAKRIVKGGSTHMEHDLGSLVVGSYNIP